MRFGAVLLLTAGCATSGAPARVALQLQGAAAGPAEQQRCVEAVTRAGAIVDAKAPLQALVTLEPTGSRLQIVSPSRGLVRDESRPAGTVEALCQDAAATAAATREAPTIATPAAVGVVPSAEPPAPTTTSGGAYRGPISDH
jgi:hypothetical protein